MKAGLEFAEQVLDDDNTARPSQELEQQCPEGSFKSVNTGAIYRREVLGGPINDYYRKVA
jgi:hypothetical protein